MLSARLIAVVAYVQATDVVADIGSDHGYIPLYLANKGHPYVYASENKRGPYNRLKTAVSNKQAIKVALADGLEDLPAAINTVVIAGMGGTLIASILKSGASNLQNVHKLIIAPHANESDVRQTLMTLNFTISAEEVVYDAGKYYEIIVALRGTTSYTANEVMFGPINLQTKSTTFLAKWGAERQRLEALLSNKTLSSQRKSEITTQINAIKCALKED